MTEYFHTWLLSVFFFNLSKGVGNLSFLLDTNSSNGQSNEIMRGSIWSSGICWDYFNATSLSIGGKHATFLDSAKVKALVAHEHIIPAVKSLECASMINHPRTSFPLSLGYFQSKGDRLFL